MMKPVSIDNPTNNDILFGRDAESWNHEGNRSFRLLVAKFQDEYHSSESRVKKVAIVAKIVKELQEVGARFLKRDKRLKIWFEVDRKAAIEKVSAVLMHYRNTIVVISLLLCCCWLLAAIQAMVASSREYLHFPSNLFAHIFFYSLIPWYNYDSNRLDMLSVINKLLHNERFRRRNSLLLESRSESALIRVEANRVATAAVAVSIKR